ncbi:MAG: DUF6516 family protein [Rhodocyclaceae bacterium]|nr:DUF6516 family protein [Rhodocyclaceae bacterium]
MKAIPIQRLKRANAVGVVEVNIWRVPDPVPPCRHLYKYRLVFVVGGERVIGFDNERGKGDHWHDGVRESPYLFVNVETLLSDFWRAVAAKEKKHET